MVETRGQARRAKGPETENPPKKVGPSNAPGPGPSNASGPGPSNASGPGPSNASGPGPSVQQAERRPGRISREMLGLNPWRTDDRKKLYKLRLEKNVPWEDLKQLYFIDKWGFPRSQFVIDKDYWASQSEELKREDCWFEIVCKYEQFPIRLDLERMKHTMTEGLGLTWPVEVYKHHKSGKLVSSYTKRQEFLKDFAILRWVPIDVYKDMYAASNVRMAFNSRKKDTPGQHKADELLVDACASAMSVKIIKWLIRDCGAKSCWDAVSAAAGHGHNDIIDLVVKEFQDLYGDWDQSESKFREDYDNCPFIKNWDPLVSAAMGGQNDTIDHLAEKYDLNPNGHVENYCDVSSMIDIRRDDINVIIHKAASRDHVHTVKHLLSKYNYHPTTYTYWDDTVLDVAIEYKAERTVSLLRGYGAKADWEFWETDSEYEYDVESENDPAGDCVPDDVVEQLDPCARSLLEALINMPTENNAPLIFKDATVIFEHLRYAEEFKEKCGDESGFGQSGLAYKIPKGDSFRRIWRKLGGSFKKPPRDSYKSTLEPAIAYLGKIRAENPDAFGNLCSIM